MNYFNGLHNATNNCLEQTLSEQTVLMADLILMEVLQSFSSQHEPQTAKSYLSELECHTLCSSQLALLGAENYRRFRRKGVTVCKAIDVIICVCQSEKIFLNQ